MTDTSLYLNNPLHGLKLEQLLTEIVEHYGWEILAEYTHINAFKNKPSMASSLKFFKKTQWAREKIERFYLYDYKNLPKAPEDQFDIPPRERIIPENQKPKAPKILEAGKAPVVNYDPKLRRQQFADKQQQKRSNKSKAKKQRSPTPSDPWANVR